MMQTGNRAYSGIERKRKRRQMKRSNKGGVTKARRRSSKDRMMALRHKGQLP